MKFPLLPLLGLCLAGTSASAQIVQGSTAVQTDYSKVGVNEYANLIQMTNGAPNLLTRGSSEGAIGSPYAYDRWLMANITLTNKLALPLARLKYDVLDHRLLIQMAEPSRDSMQIDDRQVAAFAVTEPASALGPARQRLFRRFDEAPNAQQRTEYVEVLHQGTYSLLKHHQKLLKKPSFQGAYSTGVTPNEIEDISLYYLRTPDGKLAPVKLNLKSFQSAAPALSATLKTAAATQKLRTEADWVALLTTADPAPVK